MGARDSTRYSLLSSDSIPPSMISRLSSLSLVSNASTSDPYGLTLIYEPPYSTTDIVFVHGLGGSAIKTWSWKRDTENFWPQWLSSEPGFSTFRLFTFGYDSNLRGSTTPIQSVHDFSWNLLNAMRNYGVDGPGGDILIGTVRSIYTLNWLC